MQVFHSLSAGSTLCQVSTAGCSVRRYWFEMPWSLMRKKISVQKKSLSDLSFERAVSLKSGAKDFISDTSRKDDFLSSGP